MKRFALSLLLLAGPLVQAAYADSPVLVELFASKNCRACPKAYKTLKAVDSARDDVLIMTWSVDYWDYLGDADPMAMDASKIRQEGYVERFSLRGPYTPQTVYNGVAQCPGNRPANVEASLEKVNAQKSVPASLSRRGTKLELSGTPGTLSDIWLVEYLVGDDNPTDMVHPVTGAMNIGAWVGGRSEIDVPNCVSGCAVIVQEAGFGRVMAVLPVGR